MTNSDQPSATDRLTGPDPDEMTPDSIVDNPHADTAGHPQARGTLPMARYLTDLATEDEIQALARTAPRMTPDQAARLARLLRWNKRRP
jgi:hypothetical protein